MPSRQTSFWPIATAMLTRRGVDAEGGGDVRAALSAHDWPGNMRELRNVVDRALATPGPSCVACIPEAPLG